MFTVQSQEVQWVGLRSAKTKNKKLALLCKRCRQSCHCRFHQYFSKANNRPLICLRGTSSPVRPRWGSRSALHIYSVRRHRGVLLAAHFLILAQVSSHVLQTVLKNEWCLRQPFQVGWDTVQQSCTLHSVIALSEKPDFRVQLSSAELGSNLLYVAALCNVISK